MYLYELTTGYSTKTTNTITFTETEKRTES